MMQGCKLSRETGDGSYLLLIQVRYFNADRGRTDARSSIISTNKTFFGANKFGRKYLSFGPHHPKPSCESPTDVLIKVEFSDLNPVDHHKVRSILCGFTLNMFFNWLKELKIGITNRSIPNRLEHQLHQIVLHSSLDLVDRVW